MRDGLTLAKAAEDLAARLAPFLSGLARPTAEAEGLPAWIYDEPNVFELERKLIFERVWIGIGYESDVPKPGDVTSVEYAGWKLILAHGDDGRIRCFHNVCRHRGMPIVDGLASDRKTISCPWHMWTYDLTGRLVGTPHVGGMGVHSCPGLERDKLGLTEVRSDAWMGVVFVNIDGKAPPLAEYLKPSMERVAAFDLSLLVEADLRYEHTFGGNWKLAVEGGVEDYHIPWVHRQLGPSGDFRGESEGDRWVAVTCRRSMDEAQRRFIDPTAGTPMPIFPHLPKTGMAEASIILATLPATWIAAVTDHVVMTLYIPETAECTRVRRRFHFIGDAATDEVHSATRKRVLESWALVTEQDGPIVAETQKLLGQRGDLGFRPRFSPYWETAVHAFQRIIASKLAGVVQP